MTTNIMDATYRTDASSEALQVANDPGCATRGAAWLDTVKPGWHELVPVEHIFLHTIDQCICGWVFQDEARKSGDGSGYGYASSRYQGDWEAAIPRRLYPFLTGAIYHGFVGSNATADQWRIEIANRRAGALV